MTSFDELRHPRTRAGSFTDKQQSGPEAVLTGEPYVGSIIGMGTRSSVDVITEEGYERGVAALLEVSELSSGEAEMVMTMVVRDWSHGSERLATKALSHYTDLTGSYRVIAAMKAGSV